jgi:hypothetical protein
MHDRQKISNVKIAIKFGFFVSSQRACFRPVGQFLHASAIRLPELDGQQIAGRVLRNPLFRDLDQPSPNSWFEGQAGLMSTHSFSLRQHNHQANRAPDRGYADTICAGRPTLKDGYSGFVRVIRW